ncbi:MAG: hypothetical protein H7282_05135 [Cytophagaceae bacterium]|nr:hypothetical protein [Cytophagaceae bacterium]
MEEFTWILTFCITFTGLYFWDQRRKRINNVKEAADRREYLIVCAQIDFKVSKKRTEMERFYNQLEADRINRPMRRNVYEEHLDKLLKLTTWKKVV